MTVYYENDVGFFVFCEGLGIFSFDELPENTKVALYEFYQKNPDFVLTQGQGSRKDEAYNRLIRNVIGYGAVGGILLAFAFTGAVAWFSPDLLATVDRGDVSAISVWGWIAVLLYGLSILVLTWFFSSLRLVFMERAHHHRGSGRRMVGNVFVVLTAVAWMAELLWPYRPSDDK